MGTKKDDSNIPLMDVKQLLPFDPPLQPGGEVPLSIIEKGLLDMVIKNPNETP